MNRYIIYYVYDKYTHNKYYDFCLENTTKIDIDTNIRRHYKHYKNNEVYNKQFTEMFKNMDLYQIKISKKYQNSSKKHKEEYKNICIDTHLKYMKKKELNKKINSLEEEERIKIKNYKKEINNKLKILDRDYKYDIENLYREYLDIEDLEEDINIRNFIDEIVYKNNYYKINEYNIDYSFLSDYNDIYDNYINNKMELFNLKENIITLNEEELKNINSLKYKVKDKKFYKIIFLYDKEEYNKDKLKSVSKSYFSKFKDNYIIKYEYKTRKEMKIKFNSIIKDLKKENNKIVNKEKNIYNPNEKLICDICNGKYTKKNKNQHLLTKKHLKCVEC